MTKIIEEFYAKYHPEYNQVLLKNKPDSVAPEDMCSEGGCMYETYGPEYEYVRSAAQTDPYRVWTLIDNNDGWYGVVAGHHWVNRIGYLITKEPWESEEEEYTIYDTTELREQWDNLPIAIIEELCNDGVELLDKDSDELQDYRDEMFYVWEEMSEQERDEILKRCKNEHKK